MSDADQGPTGLVTGLQVIAVYVSDLDRARGFYEGLLGFRETGAMPPGVVVSSGGVSLYLEPGRTNVAPPSVLLYPIGTVPTQPLP